MKNQVNNKVNEEVKTKKSTRKQKPFWVTGVNPITMTKLESLSNLNYNK